MSKTCGKKQPPFWIQKIVMNLIRREYSEEVLGDVMERYHEDLQRFSSRRANWLFLKDCVSLFKPALLKKLSDKPMMKSNDMIKYNLKVAWRQLRKERMYSFIKVGGFAIGITACLLIFLYIADELNYDQHYQNKDRIFRVVNQYTENGEREEWTTFPAPLAKVLKSSYPEIESAGRFLTTASFGAGSNQIRRTDQLQNYHENGFAFIDQELLNILEVDFVLGDPSNALDQPNTMVISAEKATKYFPDEDPIGKNVILNEDKDQSYVITGVVKIEKASHFQFDFLLTLSGKEFWPGEQNFWIVNNYDTYIKVAETANVALLEEKLQTIVDSHYKVAWRAINDLEGEAAADNAGFGLQAITDIHLYNGKIDDGLQHGDIKLVWVFGAIAVFILIIATINFINLSTAKSANRASEVGLRKTVGSSRTDLIKQFLTESLLYGIISFTIALGLAFLLLPYFNSLAGKSMSIPFNEGWFIGMMIAACFVLAILSGFYPAIFLSSFRPIQTLKGEVSLGGKSSGLRSLLVVFQFTISVALIICTIVVHRQMNFILEKDLGFDKEQVLVIEGTNTLGESLSVFKNNLLDLSAVKNVSVSDYIPVDGYTRDNNGFYEEGTQGTERAVSGQIWRVDPNYIQTLGMSLVSGRDFQSDFVSDSSAVIINEKMAEALGLEEPIGKRIQNHEGTKTIVGVVKNFHFESLRGDIAPLCLVLGNSPSNILVKIQSNELVATLSSIESTWAAISPNQSIRYSFLDVHFARMYDDIQRMDRIITAFASLAIAVACLGLFALSAFMIERRSKEIGIRLVLGASLENIFNLLTIKFLKLVLLSIFIAIPIAWYFMNEWLADYTYRTSIGWDVFLVSGTMVVVIALATISYQTISAAIANPVKNLRNQ